jgi:hypothetical protein
MQLMQGTTLEAHQVQVYLKQHVVTAINELVEAERELEMHLNKKEDAELQMQIRFLCSHIAGLGKGIKIETEVILHDHVVQTLKTALMKANGQFLSNLFLSFGDFSDPTSRRLSQVLNETRLSAKTFPGETKLVNLTLQNTILDPIKNLGALPMSPKKSNSDILRGS